MYSSHYIPPEIHEQILYHLPPKSLLRFKSVCKAWYSLITNPHFISSHLKTQITKTTQTPDLNLPLFIAEGDDNHSIWQNSLTFGDRTRLSCPWIKEEQKVVEYFAAAGSCNGLVCAFSYSRKVFLWNPSVRKSIQLVNVPVGNFESDFIAVGLGFDSVSNDYKVLALTYYDHLSKDFDKAPKPYAHVYSLNSGNWKSIELPENTSASYWDWDWPSNWDLETLGSDWAWDDLTNISVTFTFVNGVIHWIMTRGILVYDPDTYENCLDDISISVLSFDSTTEVFDEFELPCGIGGMDQPNVTLGVIEGSLALFHCHSGYCDVFRMKDYGLDESWVKLYEIKLPGPCVRVLCLRNKFEMLVILEPGILAFLNPHVTQSSYGNHAHISQWLGYAFPCLESLVLLDKFSKAPCCEGTVNMEDCEVIRCKEALEKDQKRQRI